MQNLISADKLTRIGRLLKPHGVNGEITVLLSADVDLESLKCIFINIDGLFVPFFLNSVRPKGAETDLVMIDGVANEQEAASLCPSDMYALRSEVIDSETADTDGVYANDLVGFNVVADGKLLGKITALDDTTENYLFIIEKADGSIVLVPVADEFIIDVDSDTQTISMELPEGLLDV